MAKEPSQRIDSSHAEHYSNSARRRTTILSPGTNCDIGSERDGVKDEQRALNLPDDAAGPVLFLESSEVRQGGEEACATEDNSAAETIDRERLDESA